MIQEIGIMIGGYIVVRMLQIILPAKDGKENTIVHVFSIIVLYKGVEKVGGKDRD